MKTFIQKYENKIKSVVNGFDRMLFKGIYRPFSYVAGLGNYFYEQDILCKDYVGFMQEKTQQIKDYCQETIEKANRPDIYLYSSSIRKIDKAKEIAKQDKIEHDLICQFRIVEPCMSYQVVRNSETKKLQLELHERKCLHIYRYWIDPEFGFMGARIQTWFPLTCYIYINGREWLACRLKSEGIKYKKVENCFTEISDWTKAEQFLTEQTQYQWPAYLERIIREMNPFCEEFRGKNNIEYYWTIDQSEWATDILFKNKKELQKIYPHFVVGAITTFGSKDVMRFLGKKLHGNYEDELCSDYKERDEGIRVKHTIGKNSIKMYDKHKQILRVETTMNNPVPFTVYRTKEGDPDGLKSFRPLRKGVADIPRRTEVCQACNNRYVESLAALDTNESINNFLKSVLQTKNKEGRRYRALRPWSNEDETLFEAVVDGKYSLDGFRNKNIRNALYSNCKEEDLKKYASRITRKLSLLRAHGIIKRIPKTHRYLVTGIGKKIISATLKYQRMSLHDLNKLVA
jgi:hypothetical protein